MASIDPRTASLGAVIRDAAEDKGISLSDLAKRAGVSRATLYNWADGTSAPTLVGLTKVADVLGIEPSEMLHRGENRARGRPRSV
ncbi:helix-turn-helix domain-containing protein [Brachybacterium alimentarium]|uniref:helix-turn-helix domain-containing protein n=1 Tax=Brachybacterium alimentarium TaxID=47845 RepID=UPI003FD6B9E7